MHFISLRRSNQIYNVWKRHNFLLYGDEALHAPIPSGLFGIHAKITFRKKLKERIGGSAYSAQGSEEGRNPGEICPRRRVGGFTPAGILARDRCGPGGGPGGFWMEQLRAPADGEGFRGV